MLQGLCTRCLVTSISSHLTWLLDSFCSRGTRDGREKTAPVLSVWRWVESTHKLCFCTVIFCCFLKLIVLYTILLLAPGRLLRSHYKRSERGMLIIWKHRHKSDCNFVLLMHELVLTELTPCTELPTTLFHTYQPADKPLLEKCVKCAWFGVFLLENAACPFTMYASQVSTKKRDLAIFWWMVGRYALYISLFYLMSMCSIIIYIF